MLGKPRLTLVAALAAAVLSACGGGGGGGTTTASTPPPAPAPAPGAAPAPAPAPATAVQVTASMQLAANGVYDVNAPGANALTLTLPATANVGDKLTIQGTSATAWTLAQNAGQAVLTTGLPGAVAPGTVWTPRLGPKVFHWLSSDVNGDVLLAGEAAGGMLDTSVDDGANWITGNSPGSIWISNASSATGDKLVAAEYGGGLFMSTDKGATWTGLTDPLVNASSGASWESVAMSQDGKHLAAVMQPTGATTPSGIVLSNDGGATWHGATLPSSTYWWRSVSMSADGSVIVAAAHTGQVVVSKDGGATFSVLSVQVGGAAVPDTWYRISVSANTTATGTGSTLTLVGNEFGGNPGSGIYVSHDLGATWTKSFSLVADYTAIATSADGKTVAVSVSDPNAGSTATTAHGRILLSTDAGASFTTVTMPTATPGTDTATDWRAVALSADGLQMAAATGRFTSPSLTGQLYTSLGGRTTIGTTGSVTGGQGNSVVLSYQGNGRWAVQSATGNAFTVH